jgi:diguanylate cyclase (GGDEF)-like protein/PAS domain S-box-containing protein
VKNLKLKSIAWLFVLAICLSGGILLTSAVIINFNIERVGVVWDDFQLERSEKARLDSALRAAVGYGGMIHDFKNFVLRQESQYMERVHEHLGGATSIIRQYRALGPTEGEKVALEDISKTLDEYTQALILTERLVEEGKSPREIDRAVKIDDTLALRGLNSLRTGLGRTSDSSARTTEFGKAQALTLLRAQLGYGGLIHNFKNLVLRHDLARQKKISENLRMAMETISKYESHGVNQTEQLALEDVLATLNLYMLALDETTGLIKEGLSPAEIDRKVKVDDSLALRGMAVLDREIAAQIEKNSENLLNAISLMSRLGRISVYSTAGLILFLILTSLWLVYGRVIGPVRALTEVMSSLAEGNLEVEISGADRDNEMGRMARSVEVFRENAIKRAEAERRAENNEARVRAVVDAVPEGIVTVDSSGKISTANPAVEMMFGYNSDELKGLNVSLLLAAVEEDGRIGSLALDEHVGTSSIFTARRRDGTTFPAELAVGEMNIDGEGMYTCVVSDITNRVNAEEAIKDLAMTDSLTGLANRNRFHENLASGMTLAKRQGTKMALLMLDLDGFKGVNDTYGHPAGDELLRQVSALLSAARRDVDTVARLGGDEFSIILQDVSGVDVVKTIAARLVEDLCRTFVIEGKEMHIGGSCGFAIYSPEEDDMDMLIRKADIALYAIKAAGKNGYRMYESDMKMEAS